MSERAELETAWAEIERLEGELSRARIRIAALESGEAVSEAPDETVPCPLRHRHIEVLRLLARGMTYKQIAKEMDLGISTVRTHLHNIYKEINVVDRAQAVIMAERNGWLS